MADIVELRTMDDARIAALLEDAREEMFNLRFQHAGRRLTDTSRIKTVRREIAQLQTVLTMRAQAIEAAAAHPPIAAALADQTWEATAAYEYEDGGWLVAFTSADGAELASALIDLNRKRPQGRRDRARNAAPQLVVRADIK